MADMQKLLLPNPVSLTREQLGDIAYMCYIMNQSEMTRWYHGWHTLLERMANKGWTVDGLENRGLVRRRLELAYGLTPQESLTAVNCFPIVNLGIEPWQVLTDELLTELTAQIYRAYVRLTPEAKHSLCFIQAEDGRETGQDGQGEYEEYPDTDMSCNDDTDNGGFYFI